VLGEIALEVWHQLVERDRKACRPVERDDIGDIAFDQDHARIAQPRQRGLEDLRQLRIEIVPEIPPRHSEEQAVEPDRRDLGRPAGHHAVEQHAIGKVPRHRRGGVTRMGDRHDAGLRPTQGAWTEGSNAAKRARHPDRAGGIGAEAGGSEPGSHRRRGTAA